MGCWSHRSDRWAEQDGADAVQDGADARPHGAPRFRLRRFRPALSGNRAFDEYRTETLRRLEEEQVEFRDFLDRLRHAKDKEEFDAFMAQHKHASDPAERPAAKLSMGSELSLRRCAPIAPDGNEPPVCEKQTGGLSFDGSKNLQLAEKRIPKTQKTAGFEPWAVLSCPCGQVRSSRTDNIGPFLILVKSLHSMG